MGVELKSGSYRWHRESYSEVDRTLSEETDILRKQPPSPVRPRLEAAITALFGAVVGIGPGLSLVLVRHFASEDVAAAALLIPVGYVFGIWLWMARRRYLHGGLVAVIASTLSVVVFTGFAATDWYSDSVRRSAWAAALTGAIAALAAFSAGAVAPARTQDAADSPPAGQPRSVPTGTNSSPSRATPLRNAFSSVVAAAIGALVGGAVGFGGAVAVLAIGRAGGFGVGLIAIGVGLVAAVAGAAIGIAFSVGRR